MLDAVRPPGVVVKVSMWGLPATVDIQKLVLKEIDLRGTIVTSETILRTSIWMQGARWTLSRSSPGKSLWTTSLEQGFDTLIAHKDTAVKVLCIRSAWPLRHGVTGLRVARHELRNVPTNHKAGRL